MRWSDERILTTHTGSLPRPPELTRLYVRRARGEAIDPAELDRLGKAALRRIVDKQIEAGVDIGNNGEQQREAFFLYVRHRMSGFGDSWQRWPRGDVERYPLLKQQMAQMLAAREAVGNYQPPKAIGEVRHRIEFGDCRFSRRARGEAGWVRRAVYDRSLARDHCRGNEERTLRQ
jgi:5-methyltetrahydropteroyltriglutamate--homocysteine methyltransferase